MKDDTDFDALLKEWLLKGTETPSCFEYDEEKHEWIYIDTWNCDLGSFDRFVKEKLQGNAK